MIDTIIIHEKRDPYANEDFRNTEEPVKVFDNSCPTCGLSLDYEGDINEMCKCKLN